METAPEIPGRTEAEKKQAVVGKWLVKLTYTEAYQKLKTVESILETLQENGVDAERDSV